MSSFPRRTVYYLLVLVAATGVFAAMYSLGMSVWEGRPRSWYQSLEVVVQTFTTTGYGEDAPWQSPQMNLLVIVLQLVGIGFLLSAVDVFVVPWLQEALRPRAPTALSDRSGHVLVCGYTPRVEVFVEEMEDRGQEYALIVSETDRAGALYEEGYRVMEGDPTATDTLEKRTSARRGCWWPT
jgi:TrkA-N domain./Ion channel.